eukprot:12432813-Alexandrium_andersonii.AAC.1
MPSTSLEHCATKARHERTCVLAHNRQAALSSRTNSCSAMSGAKPSPEACNKLLAENKHDPSM